MLLPYRIPTNRALALTIQATSQDTVLPRPLAECVERLRSKGDDALIPRVANRFTYATYVLHLLLDGVFPPLSDRPFVLGGVYKRMSEDDTTVFAAFAYNTARKFPSTDDLANLNPLEDCELFVSVEPLTEGLHRWAEGNLTEEETFRLAPLTETHVHPTIYRNLVDLADQYPGRLLKTSESNVTHYQLAIPFDDAHAIMVRYAA